MLAILRLNYPSLWGPILLKLKPSYWFCPTTEYQEKVPVTIGTTITDMAGDFINEKNPEIMSKSVCCATQSRRLVQAQPSKKGFIKTTKPVTLSPFSTTIIKGSTKLRSHGMRLNLIAESSQSTHLAPSVQCASHLLHSGTWFQ